MKHLFITGIPSAGKSYLAKKIAKATGAAHFDIDDWREEMRKDPELDKWVQFFWNKDEQIYWNQTSCLKHWQNLKNQSEAIWPAIVARVNGIKKSGQPAIFEGVNILPHLAAKDLDFSGVCLIGESEEIIFERNKKAPRWGSTEAFQKKEAEIFFNCEGPIYKSESEKHGIKVFSLVGEAKKELMRLWKQK
ncbi:hypothetical protein KJ853_02390 [Patescibacteria group bacterium]|nr:hypothetical protein [Patescibacteria group bacterium]